MSGLFDYENQLADLTNRYSTQGADMDYARMLGQQRFSRNKRDMGQNYMQAFPKFTGAWAGRLGSGVKSGVFNQGLTDTVNNFNRASGDMEQDFAAQEGKFIADKSGADANYQRMLQALRDQLARERASTNPFVGGQ